MKLRTAIFALVLFAIQPAFADVKSDIEYGVADDVSLKLDAGVPDAPGPHPVAILIHGGGWATGDKAGLYHIPTDALDKANFTWFSINYRMSPKYLWPDCFQDTQTAIRWVKAHAAEYKGDPNKIALIGYSAGGHLAFLAATTAGDDTRVQAVVGMSPPSDLELDLPQRGGLSASLQHLLNRPKEVTDESRKILHEMSAINHIAPGLPPFLIVQGDADKSVPYQGSLNFQAKMKANNNICDLITLPGTPHDIRKWDQFDPDFSQNIVDWLQKNLNAPATQPAH
jgi:acetyl esterase/lipase